MSMKYLSQTLLEGTPKLRLRRQPGEIRRGHRRGLCEVEAGGDICSLQMNVTLNLIRTIATDRLQISAIYMIELPAV